MFDLGFWEVFVICLIGLLVLGPERMAKAARMVGYWVGWARSSFNSARTEIERELQVEEMRQVGDSLRRDVESTRRELENHRMEIESSTRRSTLEAQRTQRLRRAERAEQGDPRTKAVAESPAQGSPSSAAANHVSTRDDGTESELAGQTNQTTAPASGEAVGPAAGAKESEQSAGSHERVQQQGREKLDNGHNQVDRQGNEQHQEHKG